MAKDKGVIKDKMSIYQELRKKSKEKLVQSLAYYMIKYKKKKNMRPYYYKKRYIELRGALIVIKNQLERMSNLSGFCYDYRNIDKIQKKIKKLADSIKVNNHRNVFFEDKQNEKR